MIAITSLATLLAVLAPAVQGLPTTTSSSPAIAKRSTFCQKSSFATVPNKAPVADCKGLFPAPADFTHPGGVSRFAQNGACSMWINSVSNVTVGSEDIVSILDTTVASWTTDGVTGASGDVGCRNGTLSWTIST